MEACAGAHFMARKIAALGHETKLISPQFVRPFVKINKNDFIDAEAICEAASRPSMRFVQPRTENQQIMQVLHRIQESLVGDKVKTTNQMHAFLLEFGISMPKGIAVIKRLSEVIAENELLPIRCNCSNAYTPITCIWLNKLARLNKKLILQLNKMRVLSDC
ncbi:transposase [Xenorhabdus sp. TS4]|uniref:Transposase n=1 Tax=Xenorhabdus ehlersii TaxID=290111 RepID=A0A2D0INT9_9GAMM|nr:transposase [Xenorhabdus sp. TS4]PHM23467.1 transposase [Xenorhabdus ehlersii]